MVPGVLHGSDPASGILSVDPASKVLVKTPWFGPKGAGPVPPRAERAVREQSVRLTVDPAEEAELAYHSRAKKAEYVWEWDEETMEEAWRVPETEEEPAERTPVAENVLVIPADLRCTRSPR